MFCRYSLPVLLLKLNSTTEPNFSLIAKYWWLKKANLVRKMVLLEKEQVAEDREQEAHDEYWQEDPEHADVLRFGFG